MSHTENIIEVIKIEQKYVFCYDKNGLDKSPPRTFYKRVNHIFGSLYASFF